jgi:2-polyprenyl-3-methyl-5-hydroxy-6-metoxy-1,4-benzoquinol methylase
MTSPTTDLFADKATDWDTRPVPQQISEGVFGAIKAAVPLGEHLTVMDFGAGTGLIAGRLAPHVGHIVAVDISEAMLAQLAAKPELAGKVEIVQQDLLQAPLARRFDLIVSAMAMHHVDDTAGLLRTLHAHLAPGGKVALADLDTEPGDFHPADIEGVYHHGFDRTALAAGFEAAGFEDVHFETACEVAKEGRRYGIFLVTATRVAA